MDWDALATSKVADTSLKVLIGGDDFLRIFVELLDGLLLEVMLTISP
jgi:hypothetical protein